MARICPQCKLYSDSETTCPKCNVSMQLTFLPPPGQAAIPMPQGELRSLPDPVRRRHQDSGAAQLIDLTRFIMSQRKVLSSILGVILVLGGVMFGWGKGAVEDRFEDIEVGMTEGEVRNILSPPMRSRRWRSPEWHNKPVLSTVGYAVMTHSEAGVKITVEFMDGGVTHKTLESTQTASR